MTNDLRASVHEALRGPRAAVREARAAVGLCAPPAPEPCPCGQPGLECCDEAGHYWVECTARHRGPIRADSLSAIEAWNERTTT